MAAICIVGILLLSRLTVHWFRHNSASRYRIKTVWIVRPSSRWCVIDNSVFEPKSMMLIVLTISSLRGMKRSAMSSRDKMPKWYWLIRNCWTPTNKSVGIMMKMPDL